MTGGRAGGARSLWQIHQRRKLFSHAAAADAMVILKAVGNKQSFWPSEQTSANEMKDGRGDKDEALRKKSKCSIWRFTKSEKHSKQLNCG